MGNSDNHTITFGTPYVIEIYHNTTQILGDNIFLIAELQFPVNFDIRFSVGLTPYNEYFNW